VESRYWQSDRHSPTATPAQSRRIPTLEPERRRRLSQPSTRAAPPASFRPFPQPGSSPRSPSLPASLCRVLVCTTANPPLVHRQAIGLNERPWVGVLRSGRRHILDQPAGDCREFLGDGTIVQQVESPRVFAVERV